MTTEVAAEVEAVPPNENPVEGAAKVEAIVVVPKLKAAAGFTVVAAADTFAPNDKEGVLAATVDPVNPPNENPLLTAAVVAGAANDVFAAVEVGPPKLKPVVGFDAPKLKLLAVVPGVEVFIPPEPKLNPPAGLGAVARADAGAVVLPVLPERLVPPSPNP